MTMAVAGNEGAEAGPNWALIQNWIATQQEYENAHAAPAPLTKIQRKALLDLENTLIPPKLPEPELGDENWVGLLLEYCASNGSTAKFTEEPAGVLSPQGAQQWHTFVQLSTHPAGDLFPSSGSGEIPSFVRKKDSKQYAAKCAVEWLRLSKHMPENGVKFANPLLPPSTSSSKQHRQQQQQQKNDAGIHGKRKPRSGEDANSSSNASGRASPYTANNGGFALAAQTQTQTTTATSRSSTPATPSIASPFDPSKNSAVSEVQTLCQNLGINGPAYIIEAQEDNNGALWKGWAQFPSYDKGILFPSDLGHVKDVFGGKKVAKELVAEKVAKFLGEVWELRQREVEEGMSLMKTAG